MLVMGLPLVMANVTTSLASGSPATIGEPTVTLAPAFSLTPMAVLGNTGASFTLVTVMDSGTVAHRMGAPLSHTVRLRVKGAETASKLNTAVEMTRAHRGPEATPRANDVAPEPVKVNLTTRQHTNSTAAQQPGD